MRKASFCVALTAALLAGTFLTGSAHAETINVGSGESIQSAINRAGVGDTVVVAPGTYAPFQINKDGITVKSAVPGGAHIVAKGGNQPAIAAYGHSNIAVLDFRLSSLNGDGVKIGGNASRDVSNIQFVGNTVETAAKDGLKFFQIKGLKLNNNTINVAGTSLNGNGDGGIDFVGVDNSTVQSNKIARTYGHACLMMKGGSNGNTVSGNSFRGCERDGITIGGFTDAHLLDKSDRGLEAHGNTVTGNEIQAGSGKCPIYTHKAANNTVRGNELMGGGGGCSNAGGGVLVEMASVGAGGSSSLAPSSSFDNSWLETAVQNMALRGMSPEQIKAEFEYQGIALTSQMINGLITGSVCDRFSFGWRYRTLSILPLTEPDAAVLALDPDPAHTVRLVAARIVPGNAACDLKRLQCGQVDFPVVGFHQAARLFSALLVDPVASPPDLLHVKPCPSASGH